MRGRWAGSPGNPVHQWPSEPRSAWSRHDTLATSCTCAARLQGCGLVVYKSADEANAALAALHGIHRWACVLAGCGVAPAGTLV